MIHALGISRWSGPIVSRESLNVIPVGQKPCLEIMLGRVGMKSEVRPDPLTHSVFGICCISELSRMTARINVCQRDDVIRGPCTSSPRRFSTIRLSLLPVGMWPSYGIESSLGILPTRRRWR